MVLKIRMLTSQSGPRVNRAFNQIIDVASGEMDLDEARRLVASKPPGAEIVTGEFPSDKPKRAREPEPETASVAAPENAAKRTGSAPRKRGRPRKKKE